MKRVCAHCQVEKPSTEFYKNSRSVGGFDYKCIECAKAYQAARAKLKAEEIRAYSKVYREANKDVIAERGRKYRAENGDALKAKKRADYLADIERQREIRKQWQKDNPEKVAARNKRWKQKNPDKVTAMTVARMAHVKRATPPWANMFFIEEAYHLAKLREAATGIKWHVDHIIPLRGKRVCGLHVETNLQVIPAKANLIKNAKFDI